MVLRHFADITHELPSYDTWFVVLLSVIESKGFLISHILSGTWFTTFV
jgi:hypothetical protein